jgi:hypothetical protein
MEILARQVVGYHFCSLDNESTCTIPEFVHSVAAQVSMLSLFLPKTFSS